MKYLKILALSMMLLASPAWAQVKISQMPPGGNYVSPGDIFPGLRGTTSTGFVNYQMIMPLGSSTTPGLLECGTGLTCSGGVINGASYPSQTGNAYEYLMTNGSSVLWSNPAGLIDPRTFGASCVGSGATGGLTSATAGIFTINAGSGGSSGTYTGVPITGGSGSGAQGTFVVSGGSVTSLSITSSGSGYKLRDQISAASAGIGNTTSFLAQVAHFAAQEIPVYDGIHDDTAAFQAALNLAQNTGMGVLVPNGCWVSSLNDPQGVSMVGTGYSPTYGFGDDGAAAQNLPVLYGNTENDPIIVMGTDNNNGFFGFEVNDSASGVYQTGTCIESTGNSSGGNGNHTYLRGMSLEGCYIGLGDPNNSSDFYPISIGNSYGANIYGIYGKVDDLYSIGDVFVSNSGAAIDAFGGLWSIVGDRFEYNMDTIDMPANFAVTISSSQFDTNYNSAIKILNGSGNISLIGDVFQGNGYAGTVGNDAVIIDGRNTSNQSSFPSFINVTGSTFYVSGSGGAQPHVLDVTTTGANNDYISFVGGNALNATTSGFAVYQNGQPPHMKFAIPGVAAYDTIAAAMTTTGCSTSATNASATAGSITSGTNGTCTITVTPNGTLSLAQPHGWACGSFLDATNTANTASWSQISTTTTSAVLAGTTTSGDVVSFACQPY